MQFLFKEKINLKKMLSTIKGKPELIFRDKKKILENKHIQKLFKHLGTQERNLIYNIKHLRIRQVVPIVIKHFIKYIHTNDIILESKKSSKYFEKKSVQNIIQVIKLITYFTEVLTVYTKFTLIF